MKLKLRINRSDTTVSCTVRVLTLRSSTEGVQWRSNGHLATRVQSSKLLRKRTRIPLLDLFNYLLPSDVNSHLLLVQGQHDFTPEPLLIVRPLRQSETH